MKMFKRVFSLCFILFMLLSTPLSTNASAAVTKTYDCKKVVTLTVKTGNKASRASIKFVCNAARASRTVNRPLLGKKTYTHTCRVAPKMVLKVSPRVDGVQYFYVQGWGKNICSTLKLKNNTTYTIQVSYYYNNCNSCRCNKMDFGLFHSDNIKCYANGSWYVASTKNLEIKRITVR